MTVADVARFVVITLLGVLAIITFLVAGTIIGLMMVDNGCDRGYCMPTPVGVWVLGLLGVLFVKSMVEEWNEIPVAAKTWYKANQTNVLISGIIIVVFIFIFSW
jgi:hypothetical protein